MDPNDSRRLETEHAPPTATPSTHTGSGGHAHGSMPVGCQHTGSGSGSSGSNGSSGASSSPSSTSGA